MSEEKLRHIMHDLWYQHPQGASTFSMCGNYKKNGCKSDGRGGRPCADCVEEELAKLVGDENADKYHILICDIRELECIMYKKIQEE